MSDFDVQLTIESTEIDVTLSGIKGDTGQGLAAGGTTGQLLRKTSNADFDTSWVTADKSLVGLSNVDNTSDANKPISTATQTALDLKLNTSLKGAANGLAELDSSGTIPAAQLPSYVDDVITVANFAALPATGETGKIYVTSDTNLTYRWSGSAYVEISASLALGETSSTAYRGDRGKTAYDHSQLTSGNPHNVTKTDIGLSNVDNTSDATKNAAAVTLTNKRITKRSNQITAPGATPSVDTDSYDFLSFIGLNAAITSMTTNLTGTPTRGQVLWLSFTDDGTSRAIAWGASFESSTVSLPTSTVAGQRLDVGFVWNMVTSKWRCVAVS